MQFLRNKSGGIGLLVLGVLLVVMMPVNASADTFGTTANDTVVNAKQPGGGTLPLSPGELSIEFHSSDGTDTSYADTASVVSTQVDTGFDISDISFPGNGNVTSGDSRVATFTVRNRGNNSSEIPFDVEHLNFADSTTENDSFNLELFHQTGNVSFDTGTFNRISGGTGVVNFSEGETVTIAAVITPKSAAIPGDTIQSAMFVTDRAPIDGAGSNQNGVLGDQWERGTTIGSADTYDTQLAQFITTLQGSNVKIKKTLSLVSGSARPGDTIEYTITAWNDGNQTADTVTIVDAIPDSTSLVVGSANEVNDGGNSDGDHTGGTSGTFVGYDDDFDLSNGNNGWSATGDLTANSEGVDPNVTTIFWPLDSIASMANGEGPTPGDPDTVVFSYRVRIE